MPTIVNVIGHGDIEFPDSMSQQDIKATLDRDFGQFKAPEPVAPTSFVGVLESLQKLNSKFVSPTVTPTPTVAQPEPVTETSSGVDHLVKLLKSGAASAEPPPPKGIAEWFEKDAKVTDLMPFVGSGSDLLDAGKVYLAAKRFEAGTSTEDDEKLLSDFNNNRKRDLTIPAKIANLVWNIPAFAGELYATRGLYTGPSQAAKALFLKGTEKLIENAAEKATVRIAARIAGGIAGAAVQAPVAGAARAATTALQRATPKVDIEQDANGNLVGTVTNRGEPLWQAIPMGYLDQFVETISERSGGMLGEALAKIPIPNKIAALKTAASEWLGKRTNKKLTDFLNEVGKKGQYHGWLEEIGEERLGEIGKALIGVESYSPLGGGSAKEMATQALVEGVGFAVPGAAKTAAGLALGGKRSGNEPETRSEITPVKPFEVAKPGDTSIRMEGLTRSIAPYEEPAEAPPPSVDPENPPVQQPPATPARSPLPVEPVEPSIPAAQAETVPAKTVDLRGRYEKLPQGFRKLVDKSERLDVDQWMDRPAVIQWFHDNGYTRALVTERATGVTSILDFGSNPTATTAPKAETITTVPDTKAAIPATIPPESETKRPSIRRKVKPDVSQPTSDAAVVAVPAPTAQKEAQKETPKSSTQLTLKADDASPFIAFAASIPDADIYSKPDESGKEDYGRDTEPHITALYGLTKHEAQPVSEAVKGHGPVTVTLGKISVFSNPDYDVLKVDVEGQGLHDLHGKIKRLPNESTFPDYKPHLTIAYLKKGAGSKYAGDSRFEGKTLTFDSVTFSPPSEIREKTGRTEIPLQANGPESSLPTDGRPSVRVEQPVQKPSVRRGKGQTTARSGSAVAQEPAATEPTASQQAVVPRGTPDASAVPGTPVVQPDAGSTPGAGPTYGAKNKIVSQQRADEIRKRLREKLSQLNTGIDPEFLSLGSELAVFHVEAGARKFTDFSKTVIADLGEKARPYLKAWYLAARNWPDIDRTGMDTEADIEAVESVRSVEPERKQQEENSEVELVKASRNAIESAKTPEAAYDALVSLYESRKAASTRTTVSKTLQAYSTPPPLAYLAAVAANLSPSSVVVEPTAGNGMLLVGVPNGATIWANELDANRNARLKSTFPAIVQSRLDAASQDYHDSINGVPDRALMNPPFGSVIRDGETVQFPIINASTKETTPSIDIAIMLNTFDALTEKGRGVAIIGAKTGSPNAFFGSDAERAKAYNRPEFLDLFKRFNVVDWYTVSGDLYKGMGAGWPVDVIVIDGKVPTPSSKDGGFPRPWMIPPKVFKSWDELKSKLYGKPTDSGSVSKPSGAIVPEPSAARPARDSGTSERQPVPPGESPSLGKPLRLQGSEHTPRDTSGTAVVPESVSTTRSEDVGQPAGIGVQAGTGGISLAQGETSLTVPFVPVSKNVDPKLLVPRNLASSMREAVINLEREVGPVDQYVADKLGWTLAETLARQSAAQIEATALFIRNSEKRNTGVINSDQTGVGKGRVVAAVIDYAVKNGRIPIFITASKQLYSDMAGRDLPAIGNTTFKPFITDSSFTYLNGQERELKGNPGAVDQREAMTDIASRGSLPPGFDGIFTTFFQLQSDKPVGFQESAKEKRKRKKKLTARADGPKLAMLRKLAPNAIFVIDEAHLAAGVDSDVGLSLQSIVPNAAGVFYASATFAKRPENLTLYGLGTSIKLSGLDSKGLDAVLAHGGVPMQQALTSMLTSTGEFVRREQDMTGVDFKFEKVSVDPAREQELADTYTSYLRDLHRLSLQVNAAMKEQIDQENQQRAEDSEINLNSTNFTSRLFNLSSTYLFSLRSSAAIQKAVGVLKANQKPFIAVNNTLEGPISDLRRLKLPLNFSGMLRREMVNMLTVTVKDPTAPADPANDTKKGERLVVLTPQDLPDGGQFYRELESQIETTDFTGMPISPIDAIKRGIKDAGYSIGEITAREGEVNETGGEVLLTRREKAERRKILSDYNNGALDAIIVNGSASTGLSAHTDPKFKDQRQRHMIVAQPAPDINVFMQMLGRVMRFGQTKLPTYTILRTELSAENRFMTMLRGKLTSLNANTSADTESGLTKEGGIGEDIFNTVGDGVVEEVMFAHPELASLALINLPGAEGGEENYARYATGRFVLLPNEDAALLWDDITEIYKNRIRALDEAGENPLKADVQDFRAATEQSKEVKAGTGTTPFDGPVILERIKINQTQRPFTLEEARAEAQKSKQKLTDTTRTWLAQFEEARAARIATMRKRGMSDVQIERTEEQLKKTKQSVLDAYSMLGRVMDVGRETPDGFDKNFMGVPIGLELRSGQSGDFSSSSKHVLLLATNTARRRHTVPLSQLQTLSPGNQDDFDTGAENKTTRYILSGNLLRGFPVASEMGTKGRVTIFSDSTGKTRTAILLAPEFDPDAATVDNSTPVTSFDEFQARINDRKLLTAGPIKITGRIVSVPSRSEFKGIWSDGRFADLFRSAPIERSGVFYGELRSGDERQLFSFLQSRGFPILEQSRQATSMSLSSGEVKSPLTTEAAQSVADAFAKENPTAPRVHVINDNTLKRDNAGVQGYLAADGGLVINAAFIGSEAEADQVIREEAAHAKLASREGRSKLAEFAKQYITEADLDSLRSLYKRRIRDTDEDYRARLTNEWLAKQAREKPSWWTNLVDKVKGWLNSKGLRKLTKEEAARALLRSISGQSEILQVEGEEPAFALTPITTAEGVKQALQASDEEAPADAAFKANAIHAENSLSAGIVRDRFDALTPGVKRYLPMISGRIEAIDEASDRGGDSPAGDLRSVAESLSGGSQFDRDAVVMRAGINIIDLADSAKTFIKETDAKAKEFADESKKESAKTAREKAAQAASKVINVRRGQLIAERNKASDPADISAANAELDLVKSAESATQNVVEAIRDRLPTKITLGDLLAVSDALTDVEAGVSPAVLNTVQAAIRADGEDVVADFQALKDAKDSPRLVALRADMVARKTAAAFLKQNVMEDPDFRTNWEQTTEMLGALSPASGRTERGELVFFNPLDSTDKLIISNGFTRDDYLDNDTKLQQASEWYWDYLNKDKVPNPDPLKSAAARLAIKEIDILRSQQFDPQTGNSVFGSIILDWTIRFFTFMQVPERVVEMIGGRAAADSMRELKNYSRVSLLIQQAHVKHREDATYSALDAAKSHDMTWQEWKDAIGDPVLGSYQNRDDVRIREGMNVRGGPTVTKKDIDAVMASKRYVDAIIGALRMLEKNLEQNRQSPIRILDRVGNTVLQRLAIDPTGFTVPQRLKSAVQGFLGLWNKEGIDREQLLDSQAYFNDWVLSHVDSFTNPAYAAQLKSPLQDDYLEASKRWKTTSLIPSSLDEVAQDLFDNGADMTVEDIKKQIVKDIGRTIAIFQSDEEDATKIGERAEVDIISAENFLNRPRGTRVLPKGNYEYTVPSNDAQNSILNAPLEVFAQRFLNNIGGLQKAMQEQDSQFDKASESDPGFVRQAKEERANGKRWVDPEELKRLMPIIANLQKNFKDYIGRRQTIEADLYSGFNLTKRVLANSILQAPGTMIANYAGSAVQRAALDGLMGNGAGMFSRIPYVSGAASAAKGAYDTGLSMLGVVTKALTFGAWKNPRLQAALAEVKKNPALWSRIASHVASTMQFELQQLEESKALGVVDYDPWRENLRSAYRLFGEGGYITTRKRGRLRKGAESLVTLMNEAGFAALGLQLPRALGTQAVDRRVNEMASSQIISMLDRIKNQAAKLDGYPTVAILTPYEVFGRQASPFQLSNLRQFFNRSSVNLDRAMIEYSNAVRTAKADGKDPKDVEFLTPAQTNSLHFEMAEQLNKGMFSNRPFYTSTIGSWLGLFRGYGIAQNSQIAALLRRHSSDLRKIRPEVAAQIITLMAAIAIVGMSSYQLIELFRWFFLGEKSNIKPLSKANDTKDVVKTVLQESSRQMPMAASALVSLFGMGVPGLGLATYGLTSVPESVASKVINAGSQAIQTGEPVRPAVELARSLMPNSRGMINRLEMREGITKESNAKALAQKYSPAGVNVQAARQMGAVQYSPASANVTGVVNALSLSGGPDWQTVSEQRQLGVAKLVTAGKSQEEAEKSFDSSVLQRNFYRQAWGREGTEAERADFRSNLSPDELKIIDDVEGGRQAYAQRFGRSAPDFVKAEGGAGNAKGSVLAAAGLGGGGSGARNITTSGASPRSTPAASESTVPSGSGGSGGGSRISQSRTRSPSRGRLGRSRIRGGSRLRSGVRMRRPRLRVSLRRRVR